MESYLSTYSAIILRHQIIVAMKINFALPVLLFLGLLACNKTQVSEQTVTEDTAVGGGQSAVRDDESQKNFVQTAIASPDHKTLVTALKAVGYVDALSNAGPFTVFAPNDAAFAKLSRRNS